MSSASMGGWIVGLRIERGQPGPARAGELREHHRAERDGGLRGIDLEIQPRHAVDQECGQGGDLKPARVHVRRLWRRWARARNGDCAVGNIRLVFEQDARAPVECRT